ncbi:hypothetical protein ACFWB0_04815 [Rhodococcus sp. NPDC060086]|uniref:hypothetical protein n=1 Tax=unclassified Rhodococcus (in: high G+C Gram-positive bacteria) TaxID=192944 RepID=UPI00365B5C35
MNDSDVSLWEALGLSPDSVLEPVPDDLWEAAVGAAVDPDAAVVASELVPEPVSELDDGDGIIQDDGVSPWDEDTSDMYDDLDIDLGNSGSDGPDELDQGW